MRLLIVEDDRDAAGYMEKGLKESGHAVDLPTPAARASCAPPAATTTC
jgi:DNA-binding response OmpR family regulator